MAINLLTARGTPLDRQRQQTLILIDKLGARLAFERSSVRLYDVLLTKFDAFGSFAGGPGRTELEVMRDEELAHFVLLRELMRALGADATAVTPSANLHAVLCAGLSTALADPRTDLQECLDVILVAELLDNDCWENLADLAIAIGRDDLAAQFEASLVEERDHLRKVRTWIGAGLSLSATGSIAEPFETRALLREGQLGELVAAASIEISPEGEAERPAPRRGPRGRPA